MSEAVHCFICCCDLPYWVTIGISSDILPGYLGSEGARAMLLGVRQLEYVTPRRCGSIPRLEGATPNIAEQGGTAPHAPPPRHFPKEGDGKKGAMLFEGVAARKAI